MNRRPSSWLRVVPACLVAGLAGCDRSQPVAPPHHRGGVDRNGTEITRAVQRQRRHRHHGWELDQRRSTDGGASWVAAGTAGLDEMGFYDVGQASEQPLCYRVIAFNSQGDSPPSNTDCTTLPAAPSDLMATPAGMMGEINALAWVDNSGVEDGYEVQRLFCGYYGCSFGTIATLGPNTTSYSDSDVLWGNTYTYRVVALKKGGRSDPSNEATVYGQ